MTGKMGETLPLESIGRTEASYLQKLFTHPVAVHIGGVIEFLSAFASDSSKEAREHNSPPNIQNQTKGSFEVTSDAWGNPVPKSYVVDGIGVIPIRGMIIKGAGNMAKWRGMADLDRIQREIREFASDDGVKAVVFDVDSPGGFTIGVEETAQMAASLYKKKKKPTMTFTGGIMGSAAYWIGSASRVVYATPSSIVGSVGTYLAIIDATEFYKRLGFKVEVIRSGEHKGAGLDGWTDRQKGFLQGRVNANAEVFKSFVKTHRTMISDEDLNGQAYSGTEAASRGFAGGLANDFDEALSRFREQLIQSSKS